MKRHELEALLSRPRYGRIAATASKEWGTVASIDPSIFIWLASITDPEMRNTATMRLDIVPNRHQARPSTNARQVAQFIWHLVEGQGCRRQAAYGGAVAKFNVSVSFAEKAYTFWEPIFKRAGPHLKMLTRISDPKPSYRSVTPLDARRLPTFN